ncbi:MAG: hypothetical protein ACI9TH_003801, partial [Kiritimatiellia bacterium]
GYAATDIVISEFLAMNDTSLIDEDGDFSDWIELYNASGSTVNLGGWGISDDAGIPFKWTFPAVNLAAGQFMIIFATDKDRAVAGAELHTNFKLSGGGEYLGLIRPDLSIAHEYAPAFPNQAADVSYGIQLTSPQFIGEGSAVEILVPTDGSLGATWTGTAFVPTGWIDGELGAGFGMTEAGMTVNYYKSAISVSSLAVAESVISTPANQSSFASELRPYVNLLDTGGAGRYGSDDAFPTLTIGSNTDNFLIEVVCKVNIPTAGDWTFGVNSDDGFGLELSNGVDTFNSSFPGPRGASDTLGTFNLSAGDYDLRVVCFEQGGGASAEIFAAPGAHAAWSAGAFDLLGDVANGGLEVFAAAGASSAVQQTNLETPMLNVNASAYARMEFNVSDPSSVEALSLDMRYNDGFIAYLNGVEVVRRNAPGGATWNSVASAARTVDDSILPESIDLDAFLPNLLTGLNVLAIHGLNISAADETFLIMPELIAGGLFSIPPQFFATPSPGFNNNGAFQGFVKDTNFTVGRGFYSAPFSTTISSSTPEATIVYTTDGSTPTLLNGTAGVTPVTVPISQTTTLRAAAFKSGYEPTDVDTQTYIFVADVLTQSNDGSPPTPAWPAGDANGQIMDYGMDPDVLNDVRYAGTVDDALLAIPSISIVTDLEHLFDTASGIYANPGNDGAAWERPASMELINPDGSSGFQVNMGLRIRGGFSRSKSNPKHAWRCFFREQYGDDRLSYPLFGNEGANEFDKIDLRTAQNYSWSFSGDGANTFGREVFARDTQRDVGQPHTRSRYNHLYINGHYWGIYLTHERAEARYAATYMGGNKGDYDVMKAERGPYEMQVTDGNVQAYNSLFTVAMAGFTNTADYMKAQGRNPDGSINVAYTNLLDVSSVVDYMVGIFHGGDRDAPISNFLSNNRVNNTFAIFNRTNPSGWKFFRHDAEHSLDRGMADRTGPWPHANFAQARYFNPQTLHERLVQNEEYRVYFADRVFEYFNLDGALTPTVAAARFSARMTTIDQAIIAESARWGDSKRAVPRTRDDDWLPTVNSVLNWFNNRIGTVVSQLQADGWYPTTAAPTFSQYGGVVPPGFAVQISGLGALYYTTDGTDPRAIGGSPNGTATHVPGPPGSLNINQTTDLGARLLLAGEWSPLVRAEFFISAPTLAITELMYHPANPTGAEIAYVDSDFEFVELQNTGASTLILNGLELSNGALFQFSSGDVTSLAAGDFLLVVNNLEAFKLRYPDWATLNIAGEFAGNLDNGGERITLINNGAETNTTFVYDDAWYPSTDGSGFSLTVVSPQPNHTGLSVASGWRSSYTLHGTPGATDSLGLPPPGTIVINEVLTHQDQDNPGDWIELHNTSGSAVNIGGWYLSDRADVPFKFQIPGGTTIGAGGFLVFTEFAHFGLVANGGLNGFALSEYGEEVHLAAPNGATMNAMSFGTAARNVTFGRHVLSTGGVDYPPMASQTYAAANSAPVNGPLVITEIMYNPSIGFYEFVELQNISGLPLLLNDALIPTNRWRVNGIDFDFPQGLTLAAGELVVLVEVAITPAVFRSLYGMDGSIKVYNFLGGLQNGGEMVSVQRPLDPDISGVPYTDVDRVRYDDANPWPLSPDGLGPSLERDDLNAYGSDPGNWSSSSQTGGSPGSILPFRLISVTSSAGGSVSPSGNIQVPVNGSQYFSFAVSNFFHIADVQVDGLSQGTPVDYTFNNVTGNHSLHVIYGGDVASMGTPHWWLNAVNPAWVNNFDVHEVTDGDSDGKPAWREYHANSDPSDQASKFEFDAISVNSSGQLTLQWNSRQVSGGSPRNYAVYQVGGPLQFVNTWVKDQSDIASAGDTTAVSRDLSSLSENVCIFRIAIEGVSAAVTDQSVVGTRLDLAEGRNFVGFPFEPFDASLSALLASAMLPAGNTEGQATVIDVWDQENQTMGARYWLSNAPGFEGWRESGSFASADAVQLDVTKGFIITIRAGAGNQQVFAAGWAPEASLSQDVASNGYSLVASAYPAKTSLYNADIVGSGFTGGSRLSQSDLLLLHNPLTDRFDIRYWYYTPSGLWVNADNATPV